MRFFLTRCFLVLIFFAGCAIVLFSAPRAVFASTNISANPAEHWAWNDTIGWVDFYITNNVNVQDDKLTGWASSSVGEFSLDCATSPAGSICGASNYMVKNSGCGYLKGWAWNDSIGWISFCGGDGDADCPSVPYSYRVSIDATGKLTGWAWNDLIGWISFCNSGVDCSGSGFAYQVVSSWAPVATSSYVDSIIYDTNASGSALNSFLWHGDKPGGSCYGGDTTQVSFAFMASDATSSLMDLTNFTNPPSCAVSQFYSPEASTSQPFDTGCFIGRFFRYRVRLQSDKGKRTSPRVDDVIVNWSP